MATQETQAIRSGTHQTGWWGNRWRGCMAVRSIQPRSPVPTQTLRNRHEYSGGPWVRLALAVGLGLAASLLMTPLIDDTPTVHAAKQTKVQACSWYYSNASAGSYVDLSGADINICPLQGPFLNRNSYSPVYMGFETNMSADHGWVRINPNGSCSNPFSSIPGFPGNTYISFDFEMPCKAHDYCYDLQRAGFSGTVTKNGCTGAFSDLMNSHCARRALHLVVDCYGWSTLYSGAVDTFAAPGPSPAEVSIKARHSGECAHVEFSSLADLADVNQWTCSSAYAAQRWKILPAPGYPGEFYIKNSNSGKCLMRGFNDGRVAQNPCNPSTFSSHRWQIFSPYGLDYYAFVNKYNSLCMDVPGSTTATVQLELYGCFYTNNQQWRPS